MSAQDGGGTTAPEGAAPEGAAPEQTAPAPRAPVLKNPTRQELDLHFGNADYAWVDLEGPTDEDFAHVSEHVELHPLTLQDARRFGQRPKIEDYDDYVYMVVFGVDPDVASGGQIMREFHLILNAHGVVTIHHHSTDALEGVRAHIAQHPARSRFDLLYQILAAITSTFAPALSRIDDQIDSIEEQVINQPREQDLKRIFSIKRDLVAMRRVISPMRDMFQRREDHFSQLPGLKDDDMLYFRDLYDGLIRTSELVDSYRDLLSGATDLYLSTVANRQGEVNRQLTIVATIFLPLTFFTGFFGQNFAFLTGHIQNTALSFWVLGIGISVASVVIFSAWFRRKGWIGRDATGGDVRTR